MQSSWRAAQREQLKLVQLPLAQTCTDWKWLSHQGFACELVVRRQAVALRVGKASPPKHTLAIPNKCLVASLLRRSKYCNTLRVHSQNREPETTNERVARHASHKQRRVPGTFRNTETRTFGRHLGPSQISGRKIQCQKMRKVGGTTQVPKRAA